MFDISIRSTVYYSINDWLSNLYNINYISIYMRSLIPLAKKSFIMCHHWDKCNQFLSHLYFIMSTDMGQWTIDIRWWWCKRIQKWLRADVWNDYRIEARQMRWVRQEVYTRKVKADRERERDGEKALIAPMETKFLQIFKSAELVLDVRYWKDKRCSKLRR